MDTTPRFQTKILRRKTTPEEYRVYRAGLEWDLSDPIVIETREDVKSEYRWRDLMEPYHHQVTNLITFCRRLPVTLIADDVGLGKTISAGLIVSELISRSRISKILVVCPKLLGPQWQEELLTKFNIESEIAIGRQLIVADPEATGAVITTYASARLHLESIPEDRFQMLILDEAHKLRNLYGVDQPPQVARCFHNALEQRRFRYVLMLTATPIHNRLWDLYSLVDLLTVARGHENPFGSEGTFARKFIADNRNKARQLKPEAREEFRSIVYGYMSRVRRSDAKLYFPDRVVQMHKVDPTGAELGLIEAIARPIQRLNRLSQISLLQALTSSPDALMAQLINMARNGTVPAQLAAVVRDIVVGMPMSAKLRGLGQLIDRLARENPDRWRLVVFTGRLETQTTIQTFLEQQGLKVGIINGMSGPRNQETISRFRQNPPKFHVIVSTEAGSEGINLQVANVLVNYDLPWNPMIVEQRIGRIQRLASEHASVGIFNIMLRGTFEEYIVGRLMEKLQLASHAIGDMEALLEASGIDEDEENGTCSFDERIRQLVVAALTGKNVEEATRRAEESIANAKHVLEREQENINEMIGGMDGVEYVGPRAPRLPSTIRSMEASEFALAALQSLGARVTQQSRDLYLCEENGGRELIRFSDTVDTNMRSTLYAPGSAVFHRLVDRVIATGVHDVEDVDQKLSKEAAAIPPLCADAFGENPNDVEVEDVRRKFEGTAVVRVRATVAHDSFERLVEIPCSSSMHQAQVGQAGLRALDPTIEHPSSIGVNFEALADVANSDESISEFCRFYLERRAQETKAAGTDERKRRKLEDEFTPRLEMTLVALDGIMYRQLKLRARYKFGAGDECSSTLSVTPFTGELTDAPELRRCALSGRIVPRQCLKRCEISGDEVLPNLLAKSELSLRCAIPKYAVRCSLSGKLILKDEAEVSAITGQLVASSLLKTSALSGQRAEPDYFSQCEFTKSDVLITELAISDVSGKPYRIDEQLCSAVSGKAGHKLEFIFCHVSGQPLTMSESERCEVTGCRVMPAVLRECALTGKRVIPTELERCAATGKWAIKSLLVASSLSKARILENVAVQSTAGKFCAPAEARLCMWSGGKCHPDDLRECELTGLSVRFEFVTATGPPRLQPLMDLLSGIKRTRDVPQFWEEIQALVSEATQGGRYSVEAATLSPDRSNIAVCCQTRTMLGIRTYEVGLVYSIRENSIIGRLAQGRRTSKGWVEISD